MTENLLESENQETVNSDSTSDIPQPQHVPDKFWDGENGKVRVDAMAKSYGELERKFGDPDNSVPDTPESYEINSENEMISSDAEVNSRLHQAGFTQKQAQTVYDLATERLLPMVDEIASQFEAQGQIERLARHFGGEEKWADLSHQLNTWGKAHFPEEVFSALSTTYEGVLAMHRIMGHEEPGIIRGVQPPGGISGEAEIRKIMSDPRYWRDQEPSVVARVREGFKRLYANQ